MNQAPPPRRINPMRWILIGGGLLLLLIIFLPRGSGVPEIDITEVIRRAQAGEISEIVVREDKLTVTTIGGDIFKSRKESTESVLELLEQGGVDAGREGIQIEVQKSGRGFGGILLSLLPLILFGALIFCMFRRARGGVNQMTGIGQSKARLSVLNKPSVTFDDVAGVEEAKEELAEIVEFLRYPQKFTKLGAKIPRGVLLVGPPGTGKTLVSKAVAGQAGVPFFSISGSEFVEMFVGVGASRVRDLFSKAKQVAPAIVFIDEIDAVGRHRGAGIGGGNDEREQTLNQILVEMDGFDARTSRPRNAQSGGLVAPAPGPVRPARRWTGMATAGHPAASPPSPDSPALSPSLRHSRTHGLA